MKIFLWIVVGIAVIALLASLVSGTRDADTAGMEAAQQPIATTTDVADAANLAQVRADAATDLVALRARAEAGESYEELADDYAAVRSRVTVAYQAAGASAADEWQDVQASFDSFEASARAGSSGILDSFASLIARFSADVRTETSAEAE